jgi:hypothetical protein
MIIEYLKFYTPNPAGGPDKLFTFKCPILTLEDALFRFMYAGHNIKSAYYHKLDDYEGEITNQRIPQETLQHIFDMVVKRKSLESQRRVHLLNMKGGKP